MKNTVYILLIIIAGLSTSCLKAGLDALPAYEDANVTDFYFEYRYESTDKGNTVVKFVKLINKTRDISIENAKIDMLVVVPDADDKFTEAERAKVGLNNIVGYCYVSNAAKVEPIDGAPEFGTIGNFSSPVNYKVTSADGKKIKIWRVTVALDK